MRFSFSAPYSGHCLRPGLHQVQIVSKLCDGAIKLANILIGTGQHNPAFHGGQDEGGTVFKLTPAVGGGWTYTVVYNFGSVAGDGHSPRGRVIFDALGNIYGTTEDSGTGGYGGTVFEITP